MKLTYDIDAKPSIEHVVNHYDRLAADGEIYFSLIEPRRI